MSGKSAGTVALQRKAYFGGILSGIAASAQVRGQSNHDILEKLAEQLREALSAGASVKAVLDR